MAKVYQVRNRSYNQADFDGFAHSILFADEIVPVVTPGGGTETHIELVVTSNVEVDFTGFSAAEQQILADDAQSEVSIDIATGKFVEGNLITGIAPLSEIQSDVRNYVTYNMIGTDLKLFTGVCATTQSQDYTPDIIANSRVIKMLTPAQVKALNL